jgi:hypothetical protein
MTSRARPVRELREAVPPELDSALARALERAPGDRFTTARDFGLALAAIRPARV